MRGISYAGAWLRYGFHEDAFTSGMRVAVEYLGVKPPFDIQDPDRTSSPLLLGALFDLYETTFLKKLLTFIFVLNLRVLSLLISPFFDERS